MHKQHPFYQRYWLALTWLAISILSRLMPHPFNATPLISFALCAPYFFSRKQSILLLIFCMTFSDCALAWLKGYPCFGTWSLFTYSGIGALTWLNSLQKTMPKLLSLLLITLSGTLGFWLWTNFGTWLTTSDLYTHTTLGLIHCYIAALPFLAHDLIASCIWSTGIFTLAHRVRQAAW